MESAEPTPVLQCVAWCYAPTYVPSRDLPTNSAPRDAWDAVEDVTQLLVSTHATIEHIQARERRQESLAGRYRYSAAANRRNLASDPRSSVGCALRLDLDVRRTPPDGERGDEPYRRRYVGRGEQVVGTPPGGRGCKAGSRGDHSRRDQADFDASLAHDEEHRFGKAG